MKYAEDHAIRMYHFIFFQNLDLWVDIHIFAGNSVKNVVYLCPEGVKAQTTHRLEMQDLKCCRKTLDRAEEAPNLQRKF